MRICERDVHQFNAAVVDGSATSITVSPGYQPLNVVSYYWQYLTVPAASNLCSAGGTPCNIPQSPTISQLTFTPDVPGMYSL